MLTVLTGVPQLQVSSLDALFCGQSTLMSYDLHTRSFRMTSVLCSISCR